ncbi:bardet-biedl syndrome 1 protein-like protein [Dermatophagoides farinae]|uniref:Bardet-biedl syndrome 1 protein-like protein n=2 Tax=Dermatophagoides farinae TaxID=6954 RepID=A0A9D4NW68_DERFA|nr:bardet-biedl syndrome 1 protein-like protein [Dermatophagoides farinae]
MDDNISRQQSVGNESNESTLKKRIGSHRSETSGGNHKSILKTSDTSGEQKADKWLLANQDDQAHISTISANMTLADLHHDGDYRLLIGDLGLFGTKALAKLKVYHGTFLQSENLLVDLPCGVVVVHNDKPELTASVIVASSSYLYVYRNMKPFYKFSLPPLETNSVELDAWTRYKEGKINLATLEEMLYNLSLEIGLRQLTSRTLMFLNTHSPDIKNSLAEHYKHQVLRKLNVITCMASLKKTVSETNAPSCLIVGTESQQVYILEIEAFTMVSTATLASVPVFIQASGLFDVEYRILFACRDAHIYLIKRGYDSGRLCIQLNSQPVGLARIGTNIYVAAMDQTLSIYTNKGNRTWNMKQAANITTMEEIVLERQALNLVAVALTNKTIMFYNDRKCVDMLHVDDVVVAMKYGRFGREDNTLVMVTQNGSLIVKILKRTAQFQMMNDQDKYGTTVNSSTTKLVIPKKTKLFVDQTMREREQFLSIHKTFEQELIRLKLSAFKTYAKAFKSSLNPISLKHFDSIKLSAKVIGLGPVFQIQLELQNNNADNNFLTDLLMVFDYDSSIYRLDLNVIHISCLLPNLTYRYCNPVTCISQLNVSDSIKIYISHIKEEIPLLTVIINMPHSEQKFEQQPQ